MVYLPAAADPRGTGIKRASRAVASGFLLP